MRRVLVVDDEPQIRQVIGDILHDEGYGVLYAASGQSMLRMLETELPDLVLLDLMMPDGDGWEALRTMRAQPRLRAIPVVIVSVGFNRQRLDGLNVLFVSKPFDVEYLLQTVTNAIRPAADPEPSGPSPFTP